MYLKLPSKISLKLLLRRYHIRANIEREKLRNLQDCLEEPKPQRFKKIWWLVLFIPICYTLYVLAVKSIDETSVTSQLKAGRILEGNYTSFGSIQKGRQLIAPFSTTTLKESLETYWEQYWSNQDAILHAYILMKKQLEKERKNFFTPRPAIEITEIPITTTKINSRSSLLPVCKVNFSEEGNVPLNLSSFNGSLEELYPMVQPGGLYIPPDCWSRQKVAILVPYRNRSENLKTFLINLHPFLMAQKLEYRIFVIEQDGTSKLNKGRLLNAGFRVMQKLGSWHCVVQHDVDLLPLSPRILYSCPTYPRVMSTALYFTNGSFHNVSEIPPRFGGVTAMTIEQYERVNGHSNLYRGWGNEDYDMFLRLRAAGLRITKNSKRVSKYLQLPHQCQRNNNTNRSLLLNAVHRYKNEGLSTLKYQILNVTYHHLFTHILVRLDEKPHQKNRKYLYKPPMM